MGGLLFKPRRRLPDWESRLLTWLDSVKDRELEWAKFDCISGLALGAIERQTGVDMARFKPHYKTKRDAMRLLVSEGGIPAFFDKSLRRATSPHDGNLVLPHGRRGLAVGVRIGACGLFMSETGLVRQPLEDDVIEWTVTS